jgi:glycosyltransferase involved in cell wall biosynthesis
MAERPGNQSPLFSIITPSYNMLPYLKACCHSIQDQNVALEHIIVDGDSADGTPGWLASRPDIISISEKDQGMYDAINKGVKLSRGDILAYLNCDEQYLVGTLKRVQDFFLTNPSVDILFGNTLIIRPDGKLLAFRKGFTPRWQYFWGSYMYLHSSSMFIRKRVFQAGLIFDTSWKTIGDLDFVVRVLRNNFSVVHIKEYLSAFIMTGSNLGLGKLVQSELKAYRKSSPLWLRYSTWLTDALIRAEKIGRGLYFEKMPLRYSVFPIGGSSRRVSFVSTKSSPLFPNKFRVDDQ